MKWKDHYKTLNIASNSSHVEIKKAYRQLAHKYHPDKNTDQNKNTAGRLFREITEAYKVLTNPLSKKEYDKAYQKHYKKVTKPHRVPKRKDVTHSAKASPRNQQNKARKKSTIHDFIKQTVFNDNSQEDTITATFKKRTSKTETRGRSLKYQLNLNFEEVCDGCEKTITFIRRRGDQNESAKLRINVPAGIVKGKQIRLKGEGDEGDRGRCGDLLVVVNILQHDIFKKKGMDVFLDLPITYGQAVIGGKVVIPTLRGKTNLIIPPATASGAVLCLKGEGFRGRDQSLGNLFVNIQIDIPKNISPISKLKLVEFEKTLESPLSSVFQKTLQKRNVS